MNSQLFLLFALLSTSSLANENTAPPPKPELIQSVENECETAFPLVVNKPIPSFFLNEDGTLKCNALAVPRSQAGNAILMSEWAENLNEWYQLDIEIRESHLLSIKSAHQLELQNAKRNSRGQGVAIGAAGVGVIFMTALLLAL